MKRRFALMWLLVLIFLAPAVVSAVLVRAQTPAAAAWTPLPADLHLPDGTGLPLSLPALRSDGPPLIVSNSPEQIASSAPLVALCRARPAANRFRVFFHHQNMTRGTLQIGLAVSNLSRIPVELYVARNSQGLPRARLTPDVSPAVAGRKALLNWFSSRQGADDAPGRDVYLATIPPDGVSFLTQPVGGGETLTGMYDLSVRSIDPRGAATPLVEVTTLACRGTLPSPKALSRLALTPPDPPAEEHCRGLFAHGVRLGTVAFAVTDGAPRWLDLSGPDTGAYNHSPSGEYEDAAEAPGDPTALRRNGGNYGVLYDLAVVVSNPQPRPVRVRCLLNAAGGDGCSVLMVDQACLPGPPVLTSFGSWSFQDLTLPPGAFRQFRLRFSLPGGSSGAHRLFFWPQETAPSRHL